MSRVHPGETHEPKDDDNAKVMMVDRLKRQKTIRR